MPTSIIQFHKWRRETEARLGGKCARCGSVINLEFDHIDPATKLFSISGSWGIADKAVLEAEIGKCQLLCHTCHRYKTDGENSARFKKDRTKCHGTLSQYFRYKCRCQACKDAYREYRLGRGSRSSGATVRGIYGQEVPHGSKRSYSRGCRCTECRKANAIYALSVKRGKNISCTEQIARLG